MDRLELLKKAKEKVDALVAEKLRAEESDSLDDDAAEMAIDMQKHDALISAIENNYTSPEELSRIFSEAVSQINVQIPPITVPDVKIPPINVPEAKVTVTIPEIKIPEIKVPEPKVTVNVPKQDAPIVNVDVPEVVFPDSMDVGLDRYTKETPLPVISVDPKGNFVSPVAGGGGGFREVKATLQPSEAMVGKIGIQATDSPSIDAFSRWRTSEPNYVFDTNFQYDLQPLVFQQVTANAGATVTHESTERSALMTFANTATGGQAYMQTYEHFRYQAGRSQMVLITFNMLGGVTNVKKFAGYSDGNNGIEFQLNGTQARLALLSDTSKGDEFVNQENWNLDPMDGTGPSGLTIDWTKTHILVIDFQWLGVGRVRVGFDIDGLVYYVHQFDHANHQTVPYMQTANLPIRAGMTCTGTVSTTMRFICASVTSEGGETDVGGYNFSVEGTVSASSGARTHILSVRPKTTFNTFTNRSKFVLESVEFLNVGSFPIEYEVVLGQDLDGTTTFNDVNTTYSGIEFNTSAIRTGNPGIVVSAGYVASSNTVKGNVSRVIANKIPVALTVAGANFTMGTLGVLVTGIGGASATRCILNWREIR